MECNKTNRSNCSRLLTTVCDSSWSVTGKSCLSERKKCDKIVQEDVMENKLNQELGLKKDWETRDNDGKGGRSAKKKKMQYHRLLELMQ